MKALRIADDVRRELSAVAVERGIVRITRHLDRPLYERVNKVLEALGGKWSRKAKGHVFESDPEDLLENALLSGEVVDLKKAYDFFETPPEVVDLMLAEAPVSAGMRVLEPSAGRGAIADRLLARCAALLVHCAEAEPGRAAHLRKSGYPVWESDFLKIGPSYEGREEMYDRVYMNPPFSRQQDIDHVRHAFRFLRPGGRLVSVMSAGVTFRENRKTVAFTEWAERLNFFSVRPLPADSFKASGTSVNAVLVCLATL